jgi:hypothetical protein
MTRYHTTAEGNVPFTPEEEAERDAEEAAHAPTMEKIRLTLAGNVDAHIAEIYAKWMRFEAEYREREAAAIAFVSAGYAGDPGIWVTSFATSASMTNQSAADLIIAQADGLRTALQEIGALRMTKYSIMSASDEATAQAVHDSIIAQADAICAEL